MTAACDVLGERLGLDGLGELRPGEFAAEVDLHQLPAIANRAASAGLRLATLFGSDEGSAKGFAVHHLWVSREPDWMRFP